MQHPTDRAGFDRLAAHGTQRPANAGDIATQAIRNDRRKRAERRAAWTINIASFFLAGWLFMLAVGIARHEWLPTLPTIGYGPTLLLQGIIASAIIAYVGGREAVRTRNR